MLLMATERDTSSKSWWSNSHHPTNSNHHLIESQKDHLLELQKEIKEEEEEIFADIDSLINGRSDLYSALDDCDDDDDVDRDRDHKHHNNIDYMLGKATYQKPSTTTTISTTTTTSIATQDQAEIITTTQIPLLPITTTINTTANTISPANINNNNNNTINHLRSSYKDRLDEQLFYSDDADEEEDLLPNRYKSRVANRTVTSTRRDFLSNLSAKQQQQHHDDEEDEESSKDMDHFQIDNGPPPEEVDFMQQQDSYINGDINIEHHHLHHHHHNNNNHHHRDLTKHDADDVDDSDDADGHKFSVTNQISQQNYDEAFQAVIQHVTSNLPKPCVFFLEGNCRRSDCKYSHDLSNITCKYWIEGFCFKGEMCPFLHSYNQPLDPNCLDEEGLKLLGKKELDPTFAIESEADFPSLPLDAPASALNDSTKSSNNTDSLTSTIKDQILSSNPAVVFKTVKKKRKRG